MGVSLERVQFKFASIIGELCSEPLILSQFAVWVDLKMAEYKAKGAMSLECSGDKPEPSWMKGVIPSTTSSQIRQPGTEHTVISQRKGIGVRKEVAQAAKSTSFSSSANQLSHSTSSPDRLSPELVIIKEEPHSPTTEAYPLSFHQNTASHSVSLRKRLSEDIPDHSGSSKHQRTFPSAGHERITATSHSSVNQSLLSVIGEEGAETAEQRDISVSDQPLTFGSSSDMDPSTSECDQNWTVQSISGVNNSSTDFTDSQEDTANSGQPPSAHEGEFLSVVQSEPTVNIGTMRKTVADVRKFFRWLQPFGESRRLEEIPPTELDAYLQDFFGSVTKRDGSPYNANSLRYVQASIGRYLKERFYPENITTSPLFRKSQQALERRKRELKELAANLPKPVLVLPVSSSGSVLTHESDMSFVITADGDI
ncbi:uncharacterized protein LOC135463832 [Liolophura sinensis]|uniref:uncharacterized protein LOC135463832 n=1 Tax=Liolophura sinensis TaxID=3198878 RepID=UPI0031581F7D